MPKIKDSNYNISKENEETIERLQQELRNTYNRINEYEVSINVNEVNKLRIEAVNIRNRISELQKF